MRLIRLRFLTIGLLVLVTVFPAIAQQMVGVSVLLQNPDRYDGRVVTVAGVIVGYRERVSSRGNPYTTFQLAEGGASVSIFAWKHQGLHNGLRAQVTGRFDKVKRVGQYTFRNEIEAQQIEPLH